MFTGARVHAMRPPFRLPPASAPAPAAPSTLSRLLLLPLHLRPDNTHLARVHAAARPPNNNRASSSLPLRRGRFFATTSSSSQMAAPADAPGGSVDAFELIRAHQAKAARLPPVEEIRTILDRSVRGVLATHSQVDFAYMLDVDSLGFNVKAGYDGSVLKLRIPFPRQALDRKDVKTLIVEMLQAAKASHSQAE